jgi:putative Mg2+ transporter-C (MgtC) family protein
LFYLKKKKQYNKSMETLALTYFDIIARLGLALFFGGLVGIERVIAHKKAGVRTYALVSMGSAMFVIVSELITHTYLDTTAVDPSRMASQIIVGVGFLGGGLIVLSGDKLRGLTTAAGLWVAAGIGMATGLGFYMLGFIGALFTLIIFTILWQFERVIKKYFPEDRKNKSNL